MYSMKSAIVLELSYESSEEKLLGEDVELDYD